MSTKNNFAIWKLNASPLTSWGFEKHGQASSESGWNLKGSFYLRWWIVKRLHAKHPFKTWKYYYLNQLILISPKKKITVVETYNGMPDLESYWKRKSHSHFNELSQLGIVVLTFLAVVSSSQWTLRTSNLSAASLLPLATLTDNSSL